MIYYICIIYKYTPFLAIFGVIWALPSIFNELQLFFNNGLFSLYLGRSKSNPQALSNFSVKIQIFKNSPKIQKSKFPKMSPLGCLPLTPSTFVPHCMMIHTQL